MYRFFIKEEQIHDGMIEICGSDVNHIKNVLRMKTGDKVYLSNGSDLEYECSLLEWTDDTILAKIEDVHGMETELPVKITLYQGLPKGDKMEMIVQKAVELGVAEIVPIAMKRCVVKLDAKKAAKKVSRWNTIALSAAKQAKRGIIPEVREVRNFKDILEEVKDTEFMLVPYEEAKGMQASKELISQAKGKKSIGIIIGPEGGFEKEEIEQLKAAGGQTMSLGKRILRTETAGMTVLLIKKTYRAGKVVITATQMLDSMIRNPRPTRAEATDVANAIYDGTSAIMLSGETAIGKYPVETVKTMATIAERTENDIDYVKRLDRMNFDSRMDVTNAISHATCTTAHDLHAAAIIALTYSGGTAMQLSKFRPTCPIIAPTLSVKARRQLNLSWGVIPIMSETRKNTDELFDHAVECAQKTGLIKDGDLVVITGGAPMGVAGTTNIMKVHLVGHILVSGRGLDSINATANVCVATSYEELKNSFCDGDIVVTNNVTKNMIPILKKSAHRRILLVKCNIDFTYCLEIIQ